MKIAGDKPHLCKSKTSPTNCMNVKNMFQKNIKVGTSCDKNKHNCIALHTQTKKKKKKCFWVCNLPQRERERQRIQLFFLGSVYAKQFPLHKVFIFLLFGAAKHCLPLCLRLQKLVFYLLGPNLLSLKIAENAFTLENENPQRI